MGGPQAHAEPEHEGSGTPPRGYGSLGEGGERTGSLILIIQQSAVWAERGFLRNKRGAESVSPSA